MEEEIKKIKEIIEKNEALEKEIKEKEKIINNCRNKIKDLEITNRNLSRTITLQRSELKRKQRWRKEEKEENIMIG